MYHIFLEDRRNYSRGGLVNTYGGDVGNIILRGAEIVGKVAQNNIYVLCFVLHFETVHISKLTAIEMRENELN